MKMVKLLALISVGAVGFVCGSATRGGDATTAPSPATAATPAPGATVDAPSTNVFPKCGMDKGKCTCGKHTHHLKGQNTSTNATDKVACTNATDKTCTDYH